MSKFGNLWAIGYDDMERAAQVRDEIAKLGVKRCIILLDTAVAVRHLDGLVTLEGEPIVAIAPAQGRTWARFLAGLALGAPPLTGAAVGAVLRRTGNAAPDAPIIDEAFLREVEGVMKPGTSALFVLDQEGDLAAALQGIRGLGGTVLKTTVDLKRAKLIQATLAAVAPDTVAPGDS